MLKLWSLLFIILAASAAMCGPPKGPRHGVIALDAVELKVDPEASSRKRGEAAITDAVEVLSRRDDGWLRVGLEGGMSGWVPLSAVAFPDQFKRPTDWKIPSMGNCWGESCYEFSFTPKGSFTYTYVLCADDNCPKPPSAAKCRTEGEKPTASGGVVTCSLTGEFLTAGRVVQLKTGEKTSMYLYLTADGKLCARGFHYCSP